MKKPDMQKEKVEVKPFWVFECSMLSEWVKYVLRWQTLDVKRIIYVWYRKLIKKFEWVEEYTTQEVREQVFPKQVREVGENDQPQVMEHDRVILVPPATLKKIIRAYWR